MSNESTSQNAMPRSTANPSTMPNNETDPPTQNARGTMPNTETSPPAATSALALSPPPAATAATATTTTTNIDNRPNGGYVPIPPEQADAQTAAAYDRMDAAIKETAGDAMCNDAPNPPIQTAVAYDKMENVLKTSVEDNNNDSDAPLPRYYDPDDFNYLASPAAQYQKPRAKTGIDNSQGVDAPIPPALIGDQYDAMENTIKSMEDTEYDDDAPLHPSIAASGLDDDEENQNQKPRARRGANENDDAARMVAATPPPVGGDADTQAQSPPSTVLHSPPTDPVQTSTSASSTPPSNSEPPPMPREPSVPILEATLVPDMPIYDGVQVIEPVEIPQSWLKRKQKYIFGAVGLLCGGAVATGASIFSPRSSNDNVNDESVPLGSPIESGSAPSSFRPSDSSSPSENPSWPPSLPPSLSLHPSYRPSSWPSSSPSISLSENPSLHPSNQPSGSSFPSSPPSLRPSSPPTEIPSSSPRPSISSPPTQYWSSLNWNQQGQDINGKSSDDGFGHAVALAADGMIMAVGAPGQLFNDDRPGHVKIFFREEGGSIWKQRGDTLYGEANGDGFGVSLSLSGDGNTLSIGAAWNDGNGDDSGQVTVFKWDEVTLNYKQLGDVLLGEAARDEFGLSLDLSSDGEILVVGSPYNGSNGFDSGRVQVYAWDIVSSTYKQQGEAMHGSTTSEYFGGSVSLSGDGTKVAVGASGNGSNGEESGQVRLFALSESAMSFEQLGDSLNGDAPHNYFGSSVSLSDDGTTVAIGASGNDVKGEESGQVKIFRFDDTNGNLKQLGSNLYGKAAYDWFGHSVVLSSDGNTLAVRGIQFSLLGYVEVLRLDEDTLVYKQLGETLNYESNGLEFGSTVALSKDGQVLAVGAPSNAENGANSGQAKVYNIEI